MSNHLVEDPTDAGEARVVSVERGSVDRIDITAPDGTVELSIQLTADGPVLKVSALRLSLEAAEDIQIKASTVSVKASVVSLDAGATLDLSSNAETRLSSSGVVNVTGSLITLN